MLDLFAGTAQILMGWNKNIYNEDGKVSIRFIITPYEPKKWEATTSDLRINIDEFKNSLVDNWGNAEVRSSSKGGLLWSIPSQDSAGFYGELQSNRQIVTFNPGNWTTYKEFIMWYRKQISYEYTLHFFNSSSTNSLVISSETTTDEIERFVAEK